MALFLCAVILVPAFVLRVIVPYKTIGKNIVFVYLSLFATTLPSLGLSFVTYEFSSLAGGMIGCLFTAILIQFRVGLREYEAPSVQKADSNDVEQQQQVILDADDLAVKHNVAEEASADLVGSIETRDEETNSESTPAASYSNGEVEHVDKHIAAEALLGPRLTLSEGYLWETAKRTFPLWCSVLLLILTRVEQIGLKDVLTRSEPNFSIDFGSYGTFRMSASLVLMLENILDYPKISWKLPLLYVPFILPFLFASFFTMIIHRQDLQVSPKVIVGTTLGRLHKPAIALMGALTLVKLLVNRGEASPAHIIGTVLSDAFQEGWIVIACFVGALGSFFSGSTTVSNLTFGGIQLIAAENIGTSSTAMLALQAAGGSAGNGICLNNIIAACAVVGLNIGEGKVIAKTGPMVICFCAIATLTTLAFFFRF